MATKTNVHMRAAKAAALPASRGSITEGRVPTDDDLIAGLAGQSDDAAEDGAYQLPEPQWVTRFLKKPLTAGISTNAADHLKCAIETPSQPFSRS